MLSEQKLNLQLVTHYTREQQSLSDQNVKLHTLLIISCIAHNFLQSSFPKTQCQLMGKQEKVGRNDGVRVLLLNFPRFNAKPSLKLQNSVVT